MYDADFFLYLLLFLKSDYVFQSVGVCRCYGLNGSVFSFLVPHEIVLHLKISGIVNGRGEIYCLCFHYYNFVDYV